MEINQILKADLLDLLFEGRNKSYGAYELRTSYNRRLKTALSIMMVCCLFVFLASVIANGKAAKHSLLNVGPEITLIKAGPTQPVIPPPLPLPPPPARHIARIKFTTPVLTTQTIETPPPTQAVVDNITIGAIDDKTGEHTDVVAPPVEAHNIGKIEAPVNNDFGKEVFFVQKQAQFPGGLDAWRKFLEKNLRSELPTDNGAPAGNYSVVVSFLVNREGDISEVKALTDPGYGIAAEAARVVQRGPKWIPALQNGQTVIYRQRQTITFKVEE